MEFYQDAQMLYQRQRPPWTVSVPLGQVAKRTTVKAVAYGKDGSFLGEDAVVLNAPTNQLPVEILLGPELAAGQGRQVTVSVRRRRRPYRGGAARGRPGGGALERLPVRGPVAGRDDQAVEGAVGRGHQP